MHLLIDQSRKGSAPPTSQPSLPSVNQTRNNLMIGTRAFLVPVSADDYYDAALREFFLSTWRKRACFRAKKAPVFFRYTYACIEKEFNFYGLENLLSLSLSLSLQRLPIYADDHERERERDSFAIINGQRKKNRCFLLHAHHFIWMPRTAVTSIIESVRGRRVFS